MNKLDELNLKLNSLQEEFTSVNNKINEHMALVEKEKEYLKKIKEEFNNTFYEIEKLNYESYISSSLESIQSFKDLNLTRNEVKYFADGVILKEEGLNSCIYMLYNHDNNLTKIGVTNNLPDRITAIRSSFLPDKPKLSLACVIPINKRYKLTAEASLHDFYSDYRVGGEWFSLGNPFEEGHNYELNDIICSIGETLVENYWIESEVKRSDTQEDVSSSDLLALHGLCLKNPFSALMRMPYEQYSLKDIDKSSVLRNDYAFTLNYLYNNSSHKLISYNGNVVGFNLSDKKECIRFDESFKADIFFNNFDFWKDTITKAQMRLTY